MYRFTVLLLFLLSISINAQNFKWVDVSELNVQFNPAYLRASVTVDDSTNPVYARLIKFKEIYSSTYYGNVEIKKITADAKLVWADTRASAFGIYAQKIKLDSTFEWINNGIKLTQNFDVLNLRTLDPEVNTGGALVVFTATGNSSGTGENIYAKYIGANGVLGGVTAIGDESLNQPNDFYLSQNYPNPFNPTATIKYNTPAAGRVSLKIYDILGSEVITLVDEVKSAGRYEAVFNASELASGVYIYTIQAGDFYHSRKMILLK